MRIRTVLALVIPLAFAAVFVRLGVWQLGRHQERAAFNTSLESRLAQRPIPFDSVTSDTGLARWSRVSLAGRFVYDKEQIHAARSNNGSPGVHLLTPLERAANDTLVLVTRGWVYAADAATADLARWRERDTVRIEGYLVPIEPYGPIPLTDSTPHLRFLTRDIVETRAGRPIAPMMIVMTSDSAARIDSVPRRLALPVVDSGPHLSYAIQWFAFALIALVGGVLLFRRDREAARQP